MSQIQMEDRSAEASLAEAQARSARLEAALVEDPSGYRVLTGDRPTGPLHLGHYFGTLLNRVRLQDLGVRTIVLVADYQTIIDRDSPSSLPADVEELIADYLAVGIDPERSRIFAHSQIPELNQLLVPFLSLVSVPELGRNPTVKEERTASGLPAASGAAVHLSGASGRRHPGLPRQRRAGRQGSAPAPGDDAVDRETVQPALLPGRARSSRSPRRCSATSRYCLAPTGRR